MANSIASSKSHKIQILLRILAIATTLSAACIMITNKQVKVVYGIQVDARYSYSPAFKYYSNPVYQLYYSIFYKNIPFCYMTLLYFRFYAFANIVASALAILSLIVVLLMGRKAVHSAHYFGLFLHDLVHLNNVVLIIL